MPLQRTAIFAALACILAGCGPKPDSGTDTEAPTPAPAETSETTPVESASAGDQAEGAPAIWSFSDADTTVYLFGTVHLLKPGTEWRTETFDEAFASADMVVFEADVTSEAAQAELLPIVTEYGLYTDGSTLQDALDDDEEKEVQEALDLLGMPMSAINSMKPWFAGVSLANLQITSQGYDPNSGVEMVLGTEAEASGKTLSYLETAREQLLFFGEMPIEDQIDFLVAGADQIEQDPELLDRLVADWAEGDLEGLAGMLADDDAFGSTEIYDRLIVQRNENWAPQIEALLEEPGVKMVAVGAGHLAGPDSVVEMLRARGYTVEGP